MRQYWPMEVSPECRHKLRSERTKTGKCRICKDWGLESNTSQHGQSVVRASVNTSALQERGVQSTHRRRLFSAKENTLSSCSKTRAPSRERPYSPNESTDLLTHSQSKAYNSAMKALQTKLKLLEDENVELRAQGQALEKALGDTKADCESKLVLEAAKAAQTAAQTSQTLAELVHEKQYLQKRCEQLEAEKTRHIEQHAADREDWRRVKTDLLQETQRTRRQVQLLMVERAQMLQEVDQAKRKLSHIENSLAGTSLHQDTHIHAHTDNQEAKDTAQPERLSEDLAIPIKVYARV